MKNLSEFDCLSLQPRGATVESQEKIAAILPNVIFAPTAKKPEVLTALGKMKGSFILVLPAFVTPLESLALTIPDPILVNAGHRLRWLARNAVTGAFSSQSGPQFWRRSEFISAISANDKPESALLAEMVTLPSCQANWDFNTSSGAAFSTGMRYVFAVQNSDQSASAKAEKLKIAAMVGQDAAYSDWWQLGVLRAILGAYDAHQTYYFEKEITCGHGEMRQRLEDLLRDVRNKTGWPVYFMTSQNSRFFKQNKFLMPAKEKYIRVAQIYQGLGEAGISLSKRYNEAGDWVWSANCG